MGRRSSKRDFDLIYELNQANSVAYQMDLHENDMFIPDEILDILDKEGLIKKILDSKVGVYKLRDRIKWLFKELETEKDAEVRRWVLMKNLGGICGEMYQIVDELRANSVYLWNPRMPVMEYRKQYMDKIDPANVGCVSVYSGMIHVYDDYELEQ